MSFRLPDTPSYSQLFTLSATTLPWASLTSHTFPLFSTVGGMTDILNRMILSERHRFFGSLLSGSVCIFFIIPTPVSSATHATPSNFALALRVSASVFAAAPSAPQAVEAPPLVLKSVRWKAISHPLSFFGSDTSTTFCSLKLK